MGDLHQVPAWPTAVDRSDGPNVAGIIASRGFEGLPISVADAKRAGRLPGPHRDPFDRMLIAQTLTHDVMIGSIDTAFDPYGVDRLW